MDINNKRIVASFELVLMALSIFAFSYIVSSSSDDFEKLDEDYKKAQLEAYGEIPVERVGILGAIGGWVYNKLKAPMIPVVSAVDLGIGCCAVAESGEKCVSSSESTCSDGASFALGSLCASTSFCRKGCCYDEDAGIYDRNTLRSDCIKDWVIDPNCNMPGARAGCCVLGEETIFETRGQCEVDSLSRAIGGQEVVDWRGNLNELQCTLLSATQKEGACILGSGLCTFGNEGDCIRQSGKFSEDYLCTSESLNTSCEKTEMTKCVNGKDGVYFVDSCGNRGNIYDSTKLNDVGYWDKVVPAEEICGDTDTENGNAGSKSCGNCNRFLGGMCGSAIGDNFDVNIGNFYCKSTSCQFDGESYKNGESWCVYDGKIGDGDDVVGSRHWKYVCSQGVVVIEPCADYRNQICIQQNTFDMEGAEVQFRNSACVANNWRECISLNSEEDGLEKCENALNCRVEKVDIADKFKFDVCAPKYPGGFELKDARYQETAKNICGFATQTCTVIYEQTLTGSCKIVANGNCLKAGFAQGMNDLCRGLGDCGGEVNIAGEFSKNYKVTKSPDLSADWISKLVALANPVEGQYAGVENYTEYLEAAGLWGNPGEAPEGEEPADYSSTTNMLALGMGGLGLAVVVSQVGIAGAMSFFGGTLASTAGGGFATAGGATLSAGAAGFAGAAIGAAIGMVVGMMLAKALGLSPIGTIMMAIGGAMVGAAVGLYFITGSLGGLVLPLLIIGVIIMLISLLFGGSKCKPVEVTFECKPWQPPVGAGNCWKCNDDPLKPCSKYRCESLGAACTLLNVGSDHELCADGSPNDTRPPIIDIQPGVISPDEIFSDISGDGFSITSLNGGCLAAYTPLVFGLTTDEPARCKFDIGMNEFEDMTFDLGGNYYSYNHTTAFILPDPSHGQSQGSNWTGDLTLYIKCQDAHGHETPGFYTVETCVIEGPDRTSPVIRATQPANDAVVGYDKTSQGVLIVTNELSTCRWDYIDRDYDVMENDMVCNDILQSPSSPQGYVCSDNLTLDGPENVYYIRCKDQPWLEESGRGDERNSNRQSMMYVLRKPVTKISIDWIEPSRDFEISTDLTTIELRIQTSGGGGDWQGCSYSFSGYENMIEMFETGSDRLHKQPLNRPAGRQHIYVECRDETGDFVRGETNFKITRDRSAPQIARIWQEGRTLHFTTTEDAECKYSTETCGFGWSGGENAGNGESHTISIVRGRTYYLKCKDEFGNPSDSSECLKGVRVS